MFDIKIPRDFERVIVPINFINLKTPLNEFSANIEDDELDILA